MKINYYEAFDLIAEEAVDLLAEHQSDDSFLDKFSVEDTLSAVQGNMMQKKVVKKRMPMKIRFMIAAVMVLMVAAISFADENEFKGQLITDENRHLVGKETVVDSEDILIKDEFGNIVQGYESELPTDEIWKTSSVIKNVKDANPPSALTEITVKNKGDMYVTPEIITWNGNLVILMKEAGGGWYLEEGQSLIFDVELYQAEVNEGKGQSVAFYQICDGVFYGKGYDSGISNEKHFKIQADKSGMYYIAFKNYSSDSISFKEGKIYIEDL